MKLSFRSIQNAGALGLLILTACQTLPIAIKEGTFFSVPPEGAAALQVKIDRSGLDSCTIGGNQTPEVGRSTFWTNSLGSAGSDTVDLSEIEGVKSKGSCDPGRPIFMTPKNIVNMISKENQRQSTKEASNNPFVPVEGTSTPGFGK